MIKDTILQSITIDIFKHITDFWWSIPITILLYLLFYFFTHPDKVAIWSSLIASLFEKISRRSAIHSVSSDIQSRILSYIKNNHAHKILPYGLKFKWVKGNDFSSYVEEKDVVVIMNYHDNNARNFVNTIIQYTSKAFLPTIRHELPSEILIATELIIQEKIIREERPDALDIFRDEILSRQTKNNAEIKSIYDKFKQLDVLGYFDNIFLSEVVFAGQRLQGLDPDQKTKEIQDFVSFLKGIDDEKKPLDHHSDVFYVNIILAAKAHKKQLYGIEPYIKRARHASSGRTDSLYVAGREQNMPFVDKIIDKIKKENIGRLEWIRKYKTLDRERKRKNAKMALFRL